MTGGGKFEGSGPTIKVIVHCCPELFFHSTAPRPLCATGGTKTTQFGVSPTVLMGIGWFDEATFSLAPANRAFARTHPHRPSSSAQEPSSTRLRFHFRPPFWNEDGYPSMEVTISGHPDPYARVCMAEANLRVALNLEPPPPLRDRLADPVRIVLLDVVDAGTDVDESEIRKAAAKLLDLGRVNDPSGPGMQEQLG